MEFFARICTYFVFSRKVEYAARLRRAGVQWEYIRVCGFFYCSIMYIDALPGTKFSCLKVHVHVQVSCFALLKYLTLVLAGNTKFSTSK